MRIKTLAVAAGLSVVAAVTLGQGISSASRATNDPVTAPAVEEPVEAAPAPAPAPEVAPEVTPAPVEEETPVVEEPAPVTTTTAPAPVVVKPAPAPVVEPAPVVTIEKKADPAPEPAPAAPAKPAPAPKAADPCHMDSYEPREVDDLEGSERTRAEKVDRNDNGTVCRKDIPGKGRGNTGQNSNIKDDQVR